MALADVGVSSRVVRPVVAGLVAAGVDPVAVLTSVGLSLEAITDPQARLPHGPVAALWDAAGTATGDPAFGLHVAEAMDLSAFDVQMYAYRCAPTVGEGLDAIVRFHRLTHDASQVAALEVGDALVLRHTLPGGHRLPAAAAQFVLAVAVLAARDAVEGPVPVRAVHLQAAAPDEASAHVRVFGVPPVFDAPHNEVVFPLAVRDLPHRAADPALGAILRRHGDALLADLPRVDGVVERVRSVLMHALRGGNPSADHTAARLHLSVRTLSRRLREHGTTHQQVLDGLRQELAERYLSDPSLSVQEVAFLLGFSEPSAFHRAFKRWTGRSPGALRTAP